MKLKNKLSYALYFLLATVFLASCDYSPKTSYTIMSEMLTDCKGTTIVIAKDFNNGKIEAYQNGIIVKDTTGIVREWYGGVTNLKVGDTLK